MSLHELMYRNLVEEAAEKVRDGKPLREATHEMIEKAKMHPADLIYYARGRLTGKKTAVEAVEEHIRVWFDLERYWETVQEDTDRGLPRRFRTDKESLYVLEELKALGVGSGARVLIGDEEWTWVVDPWFEGFLEHGPNNRRMSPVELALWKVPKDTKILGIREV